VSEKQAAAYRRDCLADVRLPDLPEGGAGFRPEEPPQLPQEEGGGRAARVPPVQRHLHHESLAKGLFPRTTKLCRAVSRSND
jgi:hypothetical protein